ncbi:MAG: cyclopropane-fatty-acyl-phospholipid synthase [Pelagibacteraceae bacterium]|nr:MAG: cyclopropane-fatty-acyl-phospholipid synthase [Pelagibacteraceae bacterium]
MKMYNKTSLPLDKFINWALYDKQKGYYMKNNPFGKKGDFITAPGISRLFSEIIAIWVITFWQSLGSPKKFNLIELGSGNGEMMEILIESFKKFPNFLKSCNLIIHEKSQLLIKSQKKNINYKNIIWISNLNKIKSIPSIFLANEFFDAMPIKQFFKKKNTWFERYVNFLDGRINFLDKKFDMRKFENQIKFEISKKQKVVEYSLLGIKYLKKISSKIIKNQGGILIIDYGYLNEKMQNTLQAISHHKYSDVLKNIGNSDITHNINFNLFHKIVNKFKKLETIITDQKKFLTKMGIIERAEIISKNQTFSKKADIFYRLKRLLDENEMGNLFKVMLIKNKNNKFKTGF